MEINTSSWHYRLVMWMWDTAPKSLCVYFWAVVFGVLLSPLRLLGKGFEKTGKYGAIAVLVLLAGWLLVVFIAAIIDSWWNLLWIALVLLGIAVFIVLAAIVVALAIKLKDRIRGNDPQPSMTWAYVKAKKRRICPILEFKDGDQA